MKWLRRFITWWDSQTLGTQLYTMRNGFLVGQDDEGNAYYQNVAGDRRWVIYNGEIEASRVSPEWHGWLHHTFDAPPSKQPLKTQKWQAPPQRNLTGSPDAYVPVGSLHAPKLTTRRDYTAWEPNTAQKELSQS